MAWPVHRLLMRKRVVESEHIPFPSGVFFFTLFKSAALTVHGRSCLRTAQLSLGACLVPAVRPLRETDVSRASTAFPPATFLILVAAIPALTAAAGGHLPRRRAPGAPVLAFSDFLQQVDAGGVTQVTVRRARHRRDARATAQVLQTIAPPEFLSANSSFVTDLVEARHPRGRRAGAGPAALS